MSQVTAAGLVHTGCDLITLWITSQFRESAPFLLHRRTTEKTLISCSTGGALQILHNERFWFRPHTRSLQTFVTRGRHSSPDQALTFHPAGRHRRRGERSPGQPPNAKLQITTSSVTDSGIKPSRPELNSPVRAAGPDEEQRSWIPAASTLDPGSG